MVDLVDNSTYHRTMEIATTLTVDSRFEHNCNNTITYASPKIPTNGGVAFSSEIIECNSKTNFELPDAKFDSSAPSHQETIIDGFSIIAFKNEQDMMLYSMRHDEMSDAQQLATRKSPSPIAKQFPSRRRVSGLIRKRRTANESQPKKHRIKRQSDSMPVASLPPSPCTLPSTTTPTNGFLHHHLRPIECDEDVGVNRIACPSTYATSSCPSLGGDGSPSSNTDGRHSSTSVLHSTTTAPNTTASTTSPHTLSTIGGCGDVVGAIHSPFSLSTMPASVNLVSPQSESLKEPNHHHHQPRELNCLDRKQQSHSTPTPHSNASVSSSYHGSIASSPPLPPDKPMCLIDTHCRSLSSTTTEPSLTNGGTRSIDSLSLSSCSLSNRPNSSSCSSVASNSSSGSKHRSHEHSISARDASSRESLECSTVNDMSSKAPHMLDKTLINGGDALSGPYRSSPKALQHLISSSSTPIIPLSTAATATVGCQVTEAQLTSLPRRPSLPPPPPLTVGSSSVTADRRRNVNPPPPQLPSSSKTGHPSGPRPAPRPPDHVVRQWQDYLHRLWTKSTHSPGGCIAHPCSSSSSNIRPPAAQPSKPPLPSQCKPTIPHPLIASPHLQAMIAAQTPTTSKSTRRDSLPPPTSLTSMAHSWLATNSSSLSLTRPINVSSSSIRPTTQPSRLFRRTWPQRLYGRWADAHIRVAHFIHQWRLPQPPLTGMRTPIRPLARPSFTPARTTTSNSSRRLTTRAGPVVAPPQSLTNHHPLNLAVASSSSSSSSNIIQPKSEPVVNQPPAPSINSAVDSQQAAFALAFNNYMTSMLGSGGAAAVGDASHLSAVSQLHHAGVTPSALSLDAFNYLYQAALRHFSSDPQLNIGSNQAPPSSLTNVPIASQNQPSRLSGTQQLNASVDSRMIPRQTAPRPTHYQTSICTPPNRPPPPPQPINSGGVSCIRGDPRPKRRRVEGRRNNSRPSQDLVCRQRLPSSSNQLDNCVSSGSHHQQRLPTPTRLRPPPPPNYAQPPRLPLAHHQRAPPPPQLTSCPTYLDASHRLLIPPRSDTMMIDPRLAATARPLLHHQSVLPSSSIAIPPPPSAAVTNLGDFIPTQTAAAQFATHLAQLRRGQLHRPW